MDDAIATALLTAFADVTGSPIAVHNALYLAIPYKLSRSQADDSWELPWGVFKGLTANPVTAKNRAEGGQDDVTMRFEFEAATAPDADKLVELCRIWADGLKLSLSDGTKIRLSRGQTFFADKVHDEVDPETAPYRASIDFQYIRQY